MKSALSGPLPPTRASGDAACAASMTLLHRVAPGLGLVALARDGDDERGRRRAASPATRRRDRAVDAVDARAAAAATFVGVGLRRERLDRARSRPLPIPESFSASRPSLAPRPALAIVSGSALPRCRFVAGMSEHRRGCATAMTAASPRRRTTASDQRCQKRVLRSRAADAPLVEPRPDRREHDRQQRDRDDRRDERDEQAAVAHAAQERQRQRDEREQADGDGRAARRRRRGRRCAIAAATASSPSRPLLALLAPADDDQQRVVDRDAEPDQRDEELHDRRDLGDRRQPVEQQEARRGSSRSPSRSGRARAHEPKTKTSTISAPTPPISASMQHARRPRRASPVESKSAS